MKMLFAMLLACGAATAQAEVYSYVSADPAVALANLSIGQPARRYSVRVRNCAQTIGSVMLRVSEAGLQISGAGVSYTDGTTDSYSINYTFPAGYDSPWLSIDSFKSAGKCVKSVFVDAQSTDASVKSRVRVYGN